jgi:hypothetical protein
VGGADNSGPIRAVHAQPKWVADTPEHKKIMDRVAARFKEKGGMTPALSEKIGYGGA